MQRLLRVLACFYLFLVSSAVQAGQPVFSEMPRWDDGWGYQFVPEYRYKSGLVSGTDTVDEAASEHIGLLHIEGVYTWDRSIRVTAKLPVVLYAQRQMSNAQGGLNESTDAGMGDATLGLPLKKYFNLDGRSGSWTFAPQVRIPLGPKADYSVYARSWGAGVFAGVETETYRFIGGVGFSGWYYFDEKPSTFDASLSLIHI